MPADDPLTPEEVERLPSETRFLYRQAEKLKGRLLAEGQPGYGAIGVGCDWLISHIIRAARMEAAMKRARELANSILGCQSSSCQTCKAQAMKIAALVPTERSK